MTLNLNKIILNDIYKELYEILKTISNKYKIKFNELHELYLKDLYIFLEKK